MIENKQLSDTNFSFVCEDFAQQCDFFYLNDSEYYISTENNFSVYNALHFSTYPACAKVKEKFRFPRNDPEEHIILDQRSDKQKINDILRIWSQVLDPDECKIWSSCAERDISHDISLQNGIRTPKVIIDEEIKKYKFATLKEKQSLLSGQLSNLPDPVLTPSENYSPSNQPLADPSCILPQELVINEAMLAKFSLQSPPDKIAKLSPPGKTCVQPSTTAKLSPCHLPDTTNVHSTQSCQIAKLLKASRQEIINIRTSVPQKLVYIFKKNKQLMFSFLYILKSMFSLTKRLNRFYNNLHEIKRMSNRIIKVLCTALVFRNLVDKDWLQKPQLDFIVSVAGHGPMLDLKINDIKAIAVLDTGSSYTLVPYSVWTMLNLNSNALDTSIVYNISSASHLNHDAVLGKMKLSFSIKNNKGICQLIKQDCLILRPTLQLSYILLGNDFLRLNLVSITYSEKDSQPITKINHEVIPLLTKQDEIKALFVGSFFSQDQQIMETKLDIPQVNIYSNQADLQPCQPNVKSNQPHIQPCISDMPPCSPDSQPCLHDSQFHPKASHQTTQGQLVSVQLACGTPESVPEMQNIIQDKDFHDIRNINSHLEDCKLAKFKHNERLNTIHSYSVQPLSTADFIQNEQEKKSIIPDIGQSTPTAKLSHLSPLLQQEMKVILDKHSNLFSRSKHHLGSFKGFEAIVEIDKNSKLNCRQAPRNRILPASCKQDLLKYKQSGLFDYSTGLADDYCANITLVLRNQVKEGKDTTKATKYIQKQALKSQKQASKSQNFKTETGFKPQTKTQIKTQTIDNDTPDCQRSLYRMTLDYRLLNKKTLNEKTSQLPSIQSIESKFFDSLVTTMDLANCYPSIIIKKSSRNYFNFFVESEIWHHARLPQGWAASLSYAQKAVLWTFRDEALKDFLKSKDLPPNKFPYKHFHEFVSGFVDDLALHTSKVLKDAEMMHILCIEAVFHALEAAGWLVKLEICTFMNPHFVFLGLFWNLDEQSSIVQNDRVKSILNHRVPRSLPELASRLATIQYYASHIPLMKRVSIPLYKILKTGIFEWTRVHAESYGNLLFLMALQIRNTIFNPNLPICSYADTSMLETGLLIFQWNPEKLNLNLVHTKSILLPTAIRKQASVHRECFGISALLSLAKPYLFQSTAAANFLFNDASCISYISRCKPFSSFLQTLAEDLSMYPNLVIIHLPGRALWYADILSRQYDNVLVQRQETNLSKDQALLVPALRNIAPGAILTNEQLRIMFAKQYDREILDTSDSDFKYVQRINWSLYNNPRQFFTSEREFLLGGLIGKMDPQLSLELPTIQDIFRVKETSNKIKTKLQKIEFIKKISESLAQLPYDSRQLQKLTDFLRTKAKEYKIPSDHIEILSNYVVTAPTVCNCVQCSQLQSLRISNSLSNAEPIFLSLKPILHLLNIEKIDDLSNQHAQLTCQHAKDRMSSYIIDRAIEHCTNSDTFYFSDNPILIFKYHYIDTNIIVQFEGKKVQFCLKKEIQILPGEICQLNIGFHSDLQAVPDIDSDLDEKLAISPQIHFQPQLSMENLNIANCSNKNFTLPIGTVLIEFHFPTSQVIGIFRDLNSIKNSFKLDQNIVNFHFLQNTAEVISKVATKAYIKNLTTYTASASIKKSPQKDKEPLAIKEDDIFSLTFRNKNIILQASTLINGLLKKNFSCSPSEMKSLQQSDLKLKTIYQDCEIDKNNQFVIINKILFKKSSNRHIFCAPELLCKDIIVQSHNRNGFHFTVPQMATLLQCLIYHPDLQKLIKSVVHSCLICTISQPKRVRKLIGSRRSNFYVPNQCLVIDSMILPKSQYGHNSALILVDSCTGYIIAYPSTNLKASSVRKHLLTYLSSHPIPSEIKADFGSEFKRDLDSFLSRYNIQLNSSKPFSKGSTGSAEAAIRLLKGGLRQLCLANTSNWPELIPLLIQGLNSTGLYGTATTRQQLYFSPYSFANNLHLDGLLWPEIIFNENYERLQFIINKRKKNLKTRQNMDKISYQEGNLVLAINHPVSQSNDQKGKSQELRLTTRGVYYVTRVCPAHLRLVGLFTGETRNMPREYVTKITLSNLTQLQTYLQSYQLSKISDSLFRANKFLSPDQEKTWQFLLNRNQNKDLEQVYYDEDLDHELPDDQDPYSSSLVLPPVSAGPDLPQIAMPPADAGPNSPQIATMNSGLHDSQASSSQPDFANHQLRSGKAYCTLATAPCKPILKSSHVTSLNQTLPLVANSTSQHQKCDPGCCVKQSNKKLTFDDQLTIRFATGNQIKDYRQKVLIHPIIKPSTRTFVMLSSIGIDCSNREMIYKVNWSTPNRVNSEIKTFFCWCDLMS